MAVLVNQSSIFDFGRTTVSMSYRVVVIFNVFIWRYALFADLANPLISRKDIFLLVRVEASFGVKLYANVCGDMVSPPSIIFPD